MKTIIKVNCRTTSNNTVGASKTEEREREREKKNTWKNNGWNFPKFDGTINL